MMGPMFPVAVGVDWARETVQVCVREFATRKEWQREFACVGEGLHELVEWLPEVTGRELSEMGVVIERPEGLVVEHLLSSGLAVHHLKASQAKAMRAVSDASGAKDDERDARSLANALEMSVRVLRRVEAPPESLLKVRALDRYLTTLKGEAVRMAQTIREHLGRFYPELLQVLGSQPVSAAWFLDLLTLVPTPDRGERVRVSTLEQRVRKHRLKRFDGAKLKAALSLKPALAFAGTVAASALVVKTEARRLKDLLRQKAELTAQRDDLVTELAADADRRRAEAGEAAEAEPGLLEVVNSMPGIGREVLATLLAEGGEVFLRGEYRKLRQLAGVAPVTLSSGRTKRVRQRWARNGRLATAVFQAARVHAQRDPGGRAYYRKLMERGDRRGTAVRKVGDRMLRVLMAMVRDRTRYDGSRWAPEEAAAAGRGVDEGGLPGGREEEGSRAEDEGSGATGVRRPREVRPRKSGAPPVGPGREFVIASTPLVGDGAPRSTPMSSIGGKGLGSGSEPWSPEPRSS